MSGAQIAREIDAALAEVGRDTGAGDVPVTFLEPSGEPSNPWDAEAGAPIERPIRAMVQNYPLGMIDGTLIRQEDRRLMVSASGPEPKVNWRLSLGGVTYSIISIRKIAPGNVPLYFEVQARA